MGDVPNLDAPAPRPENASTATSSSSATEPKRNIVYIDASDEFDPLAATPPAASLAQDTYAEPMETEEVMAHVAAESEEKLKEANAKIAALEAEVEALEGARDLTEQGQ